MKTINIIDLKTSNINSISNAITNLGYKTKIITHPEQVEKANIIIPGNGAFNQAIKKIKYLKFDKMLEHLVIKKKIPVLGICLGYQILFDTGKEFGNTEGLKWINGNIESLGKNKFHIGWNKIKINNNNKLFNKIPNNSFFYFSHSFAKKIKNFNKGYEKSFCEFEGMKILSSIEKNNIYGVQFHPEKSQLHGMQLLKNFCEINYV